MIVKVVTTVNASLTQKKMKIYLQIALLFKKSRSLAFFRFSRVHNLMERGLFTLESGQFGKRFGVSTVDPFDQADFEVDVSVGRNTWRAPDFTESVIGTENEFRLFFCLHATDCYVKTGNYLALATPVTNNND